MKINKSFLFLMIILLVLVNIVFSYEGLAVKVTTGYINGSAGKVNEVIDSMENVPTNNSYYDPNSWSKGEQPTGIKEQAFEYDENIGEKVYIDEYTERWYVTEDITMEEMAAMAAGNNQGSTAAKWLETLRYYESQGLPIPSTYLEEIGVEYFDIKVHWDEKLGEYVRTVTSEAENAGKLILTELEYYDANGELKKAELPLLNTLVTYGKGKVLSHEEMKELLAKLEAELGGSSGGSSGVPQFWEDRQAAKLQARVYSEKYDVFIAIPTSEYVYGSLTASDMSWYYKIVKATDSHTETVNNVPLSWNWKENGCWRCNSYEYDCFGDDCDMHCVDDEWYDCYTKHGTEPSITGTYTTHYFKVEKAEMNLLKTATLNIDSIGKIVELTGNNLAGSINRDGGIVFERSRFNDRITGACRDDSRECAVENARATLVANIKRASKVKNDTLVIKTNVLGGETEYGKEFGATPYVSPSYLNRPSQEDISKTDSKLIPETLLNNIYYSYAQGSYVKKDGFDGRDDYTLSASADFVRVHTPVVNNATITTSEFVNQKINKDANNTYLMLDEEFTIEIPNNGTHASYKGYGTRGYNSYQAVPGKVTNWGKIKDVKLPFDAYLHVGNDRVLLKAGVWLSESGISGVSASSTSYTFTVPVWTKEGNHTIETRVVAENAQNYNLTQESANINPAYYVATKNIAVEVIGKIYDLRVSASNDPAWTNIYSQKTKQTYITADEFPFGQVGQNRVTAYKFAPKLGYTFVFDFKTKGTKSNNIDVSIEPEGFYFVSKDGGEAKKVDLYYHTNTNKYVKIDDTNTAKDNVELKVNLSNSFMKVVAQELVDSVRIMKSKYNYTHDVVVGTGFSKMNLPENLRLCYNNFAEYIGTGLYKKAEAQIATDASGSLLATNEGLTGRDTVIRAVGHWYAGYRLPASTRALDPNKATISQATANPDLFEDNGYILVKFDIVTNYNQYPYLKYMGPESLNEDGTESGNLNPEKDWTKDGTQEVTLPNGKPATVPVGTIGIYETDLRSSNDVETSGTH